MDLMGKITAAIDAAKRTAGKRVSDLTQNPGRFLEMSNDQAANYNANAQPTIQGGELTNRPLTPEEIDQKSTDLAMAVMPAGVGRIKGKLKIDNPGGHWLKEEQAYAASKGLNKHGAPQRFGATTGRFTESQDIPVDVLAKLKGTAGEQSNVRAEDLAWLKNHMQETGKLPLMDDGRQYAPYINVDQFGVPWVNEGNHRIMAAKALGWKFLPTEITYHSGGEAVPGVLSPSSIDAFPPLNEQIIEAIKSRR